MLCGTPHPLAAETEARTQMIDGADGTPLAVTLHGSADGPPIVLLHNLMASAQVWEKQQADPALAEFRLVSIDLRGHGSSAKPYNPYLYRASRPWADDVAGVIETLSLTRPVIVGWGLGALTALDYVRHHGTDNLGGLVIVGSTAGLTERPPPPPETPESKARTERSRSPDQRVILEWTKGFIEGYLLSQGPLPDDERERLVVSAMLVPHYVRRFVRGRPMDNRDLAGEIDVPIRFVVGGQDASVKADAIATAVESIGENAEVTTYEDSGALMFWYQAARFNRELASFVRRVQDAAGPTGRP